MKKIKVSTIIVTYNSAKWILNCVNSLLNQNNDFVHQIIIVDNGSTDTTLNIIENNFLVTKNNIILIKSNNNGFGAGNNLGLKYATGDYLFFVNPDTFSAENCIKTLITPLISQDLVTTPKITILNNETEINTCGNLIHFTGLGFVNHFKESSSNYTEIFEVPAISGAAFAIRKDTFKKLGKFDEDFFLYMEDTELSWRINKAKLKVLCCANTSVAHEYEFKLTSQKIAFLEKGRILILRKHYTLWQQILLFPSFVIAFGFSLIMSLKFGPRGLISWLKALWSGYRYRLTQKNKNFQNNIKQNIPFNLFSKNIFTTFTGKIINAFLNANQFIMKVISNG